MALTTIQTATAVTSTGNIILWPTIASLADGGFAITYTFGPVEVATQVFDAAGQFVGGGNIVKSGLDPVVAGLSGGGYAVAWEQISSGIFTATFDASGNQVSANLDASHTSSSDFSPQIFSLPTGGYALTWLDQTTFDSRDIFFAAYDSSGNEVI